MVQVEEHAETEDQPTIETEQIRFKELLKDPLFREWTMTPVKSDSLLGDAKLKTKPWRVYGKEKKDSLWQKKDFGSWKKAYKLLVSLHKRGYYDLALMNRVDTFRPPVVRKGNRRVYHRCVPDEHEWCGYCRRPTRFKRFSKHHALPGMTLSHEFRCTICGIRQVVLKQYPGARRRGE